MTSRLAEEHPRPESGISHPQDKDCKSSTLSDSVNTLAVLDALPGQELQDGAMSRPAGPSSSADESKEIVITAIRAIDVAPGLGPLPVEFYIVLHHSDLEWRTENKRPSANGDVEWTGPIPLPSDLSVTIRFEIYATPESQPTSGGGEQLQSVMVTVKELMDRSAKAMAFRFSPKDGDVASPRSSVLVTVKQKCEDNDPLALKTHGFQRSNPESRDEVEDTTDQGLGAFEQLGDRSRMKLDSTPGFMGGDLMHSSAWLLEQYQRSGDLADLQRAIAMLEGLTKSTSIGDNAYRTALVLLGTALSHRFNRLGEPGDLEDMISRQREAVYLTPPGDPQKHCHLNNLGTSYQTRFKCFGQTSDIEGAISWMREAVDLTPHSHPHKPLHLINLANSYETRFEWFGQLSDIENVIVRMKEAIHLTPHGHPEKPCYLNNLANSYRTRFERLGQLSDLEDMISRQQEAVNLMPHGHPDWPSCLSSLGISYQARFKRLGRLGDLENAISRMREAVDLIPHGHPDKPRCLNNLGNSYEARFRRLGQLSDIEDAILRQREAVQLCPHCHPNKPLYLNNLGNVYQSRFQRLGQLSDLEDAISRKKEAVDLTSHGHPNKFAYLINLGHSYQARFERLGQLNDLEDGILRKKEAVDLVPHGHTEKPHCLHSLGVSYHARFERLGQLSDLENAILRLKEAVNLTPLGHLNKPYHLSSLGNTYRVRFECFGQLSDLENAISRMKEAVDLTPPGHPQRACYLSNLGVSYRTRFQRLGQLSDLEDAISRMREAVNFTPPGHPDGPRHLGNLGNSYQTRFERLGQLSDLEDAIWRKKEAVDLTPLRHPEKPLYLSNLGNSYRTRFDNRRELHDIEDAISSLREAVALTPHGHPEKSRYLNSLAKSYQSRFDSVGKLSDLEHAISLYSYVASAPIGRINIRLSAAGAWISCARLTRHHSLLYAYSTIVTLLPQLAWIGHSLSHRYDELTRAAGVVREAAAAALEEGFPERAVEWLEQGRSIIWGELLQLRNSYEELSSAHPDQACRLHELSTQLDQASATHEQLLSALLEQNPCVSHRPPESLQQVADRHRVLAIERDRLLQEIRRLPGFERFLLHKKFSQLRASAHSGPVALLNVTETRCDALILVANVDHVIHVPLPSFTSKRSIDLQNTMKYFVRHARDGKIAPLKGISWESVLPPLWKTVVKPVLDSLAFSVVPKDLSRIFWCPTGPLAFLPIHAAGLYNIQYSTPGNKVFDFVISSYVPTLAILAPSPNPDPAVPVSNDLRILTVAQPPSDGQSPLQGVAVELAHIRDAIEHPSSVQTVLVESSVGTVEEVLALMKETDWVHFACHGTQDGVNSGLCLADRRRLKLVDLVALSRPHGGLAFLSACQTATGEKKLSDEAIHMAAGMLFAGYRGVIGTMWSISDDIAPRVARDVYAQLLKKGKRPDYREAAWTLHDAIEGLRNTEVPFTEWIPFIHVGL